MKTIFRIIVPIILIAVFVVLNIIDKVNWKATDYLSFGMIVLTYFYVVFTWEMLQRIETQNYLEKRPYIIADFYKERQVLKIYVENIGKTPAKNVKVKLQPDIVTFQSKSLNQTLFENPIQFFPPGKKVETAINSMNTFFKEEENRNFQIKILYEDVATNKEFSEVIDIDLDHLAQENDIITKTTHDLVKSIDKLTNEIKRT
ncbi:hypothetical protein SAMN04488033_13025 [Salegentibacter agarivorans]|jgi:hypothetical protein|uniref:Uncharacterized protein n=2 Tax=Salegentibacter TaxID=143222 RepID=A0A1I2PLB3_9FLAO|nr:MULTISPECIES: hypothetical protein [Salegentibacter]APS40200.1 hypothetical protein AO058_15520 [Salegentibacter sp. T436]SFG14201.1 hypothetical protein SAMN04488033_13025 [Salegentibacter agarivorans]|tara:strand:+ start:69 stop:674 length:606 start_codon:yes stop_codon:yes gene_type:complete